MNTIPTKDPRDSTPCPTVTVLMPTFNAAAYVAQAVDSILAQTYADFEFIVVEDASTDGTLGILGSYDDDRLMIIRNSQNMGVARALNCGLSQARGQYVARMDADDRCSPDRFAKQVEYLEQHDDVAVLGTWAACIDGSGRASGGQELAPEGPEAIRWAVLHCPGTPVHPSVLMRSGVIKASGRLSSVPVCGGLRPVVASDGWV